MYPFRVFNDVKEVVVEWRLKLLGNRSQRYQLPAIGILMGTFPVALTISFFTSPWFGLPLGAIFLIWFIRLNSRINSMNKSGHLRDTTQLLLYWRTAFRPEVKNRGRR
ncbi:Uncharacterised protein [Mycobacteroides abscessus subsp. abscessus]|nr:Uncharacterised protein [Mycobacteroides abscessus subsp. abscessus]